jgi:hypothetical protein
MLKNGLVIRKSEGHEAAELLCDIDEAKGLREIASRHCARQLYCRQDAGLMQVRDHSAVLRHGSGLKNGVPQCN